MQIHQSVRCANCGSQAQRRLYISEQPAHQSCPGRQVIHTECPTCDYLLVMCSLSGQVLEAYAPGISALTLSIPRSQKSAIVDKPDEQTPGNSTAIAAPIDIAKTHIACA